MGLKRSDDRVKRSSERIGSLGNNQSYQGNAIRISGVSLCSLSFCVRAWFGAELGARTGELVSLQSDSSYATGCGIKCFNVGIVDCLLMSRSCSENNSFDIAEKCPKSSRKVPWRE